MPMITLYMPLVINLEEINNRLHFDFDLVSKWFEDNYIVLNGDKFLILRTKVLKFICIGIDAENET